MSDDGNKPLESWSGDRVPDRSLMMCELCLSARSAESVKLYGIGVEVSFLVPMTQMPAGHWVARLLLPSGPHTFYVQITENYSWELTEGNPTNFWESTVAVPEFSHEEGVTKELRIWIHEPNQHGKVDRDRIPD